MSKMSIKEAPKLLFKMLSNDVRLKIIETLISNEKSVGELCKAIGEEQARVSHELQRLSSCGLVHQRREGKLMVYSIADRKTILLILTAANNYVERLSENATKRFDAISRDRRLFVNAIPV
jgi:DNA-binding transcriptional ArsR family regulator